MKRMVFPVISVFLVMASALSGMILSGYTAKVSGESMQPTLYSYDMVYGMKNPSISDLSHMDIIVFNDQYKWSGKHELLIKRVIGLPGDTLTISPQGIISVNGKEVSREQQYTAGCVLYDRRTATIHIPKGKIFVRGDNLNVSNDSRYTYCTRGKDYLVNIGQVSLLEKGIIHTSKIIGRS